jgi:hypothetical protein
VREEILSASFRAAVFQLCFEGTKRRRKMR